MSWTWSRFPANSGQKVKKICEKFKLVDPFRTLHPNKIEFTYIPAIVANTNRSKLDYFLVSETIFGNVSKCGTTNCLACTSFDHKPVNLSFKKIKNIGKIKQVQNNNLKDPNLKMAVETAAIECYLHHVTRTENLNELLKTRWCERLLACINSLQYVCEYNSWSFKSLPIRTIRWQTVLSALLSL